MENLYKNLRKKFMVFVFALAMVFTVLFIPEGVGAGSGDEAQKYKLVDAASIVPGREYILLWNKALADNSDSYYALTSGYSAVGATAIASSCFSTDKLVLSIPASVDQRSYVWRTAYNTGTNPVTGYLFQDTAYGTFLRNNSGTLEVTTDPVGTSGTDRFVSCCFSHKETTASSVTYNQLVSGADKGRFLRYSVTGNNFKLGASATVTDVNNSCMYVYEKIESDKYVWQLSDKLESNSEYLICDANEAGSGKILTFSGDRAVGEDTVTIISNANGSCITSGDTINSTFYSYGLGDGTYWLDNYYDVSKGETPRIKSGALTLTANHVDSTYYTQFAYAGNKLILKKVFCSDTKSIGYNNGFCEGDGKVYLYKKVFLDESGAPEPTKVPIAVPTKTPVPTITPVPTNTPAPISTPVRVPDSPSIEEKGYASIMTMSDYQKWNSNYTADNWDFLRPQLTNIVNGVYDAGVRPDYFLFGGDFSCLKSAAASEEGMKQVTDAVYSRWHNLSDENSVIIQGNHDPAETSGLAEEGAHYYDSFIIYVINEDNYPSTQGTEDVLPIVEKTAEEFTAWADERIVKGETRPVLLATHTGLHYDIDREDGNNQYAHVLFDAVNEAARSMDIIFMFGHNHTNGDEQVGGSITYYEPGSELNICTETSIDEKSGTPNLINFTYMNYGYIGYIGDVSNNESEFTPTELLVATDMKIYPDRITIERYSANGHEADFDREITRQHAPAIVPEPTMHPDVQAAQTPDAEQPPVVTTTQIPAVPTTAPANANASISKAKSPALEITAKSSVKKGKKLTLKAALVNKTAKAAKIKWKITKGSKLCKLNKTVGKSVILTAKKKGKVRITVTCGSLKKNISIKIK